MPKYYTLQVLSAELWGAPSSLQNVGDLNAGKSLYAEIIVDDTIQRTRSIDAEIPLLWEETFPVLSESAASLLSVQIKQDDDKRACISTCEVTIETLLSLCHDGEAQITLRFPGHLNSKKIGTIHILLVDSSAEKTARLVSDQVAYQLVAQWERPMAQEAESEKNTTQDGTSMISSHIDRDTADKVFDAVKKRPEFTLAWNITMMLDSLLSHHIQLDNIIHSLVEEIVKIFRDLTKDNSDTMSEKLGNNKLLDHTIQCGIFIKTCSHRSSHTLRLCERIKLGVLKKRLRDLVDLASSPKDYEDLLKELRRQLRLEPDSIQRTDLTRCMEGTCVGVLREIDVWIEEGKGSPNVLLLLGENGLGKSTIAATIAHIYKTEHRLWCYLRFWRRRSDPKSVIKRIAWELASYDSGLAAVIKDNLSQNPQIPHMDIREQLRGLLQGPLSDIAPSINHNILIILDALDECGSINRREELLHSLKELNRLPGNFKFLITSRPEEDISSVLQSQNAVRIIELDRTSEDIRKDIHFYIDSELESLRISGHLKVPEGWLWEENMSTLSQASEGRFIWASTLLKCVVSYKSDRFGRLKWLTERALTLDLNELYEIALDISESVNRGSKSITQKILSLIFTAKEPLVDDDIDKILNLQIDTSAGILSHLRTFLEYESSRPITFHHASLYDYIIGTASKESSWFISSEEQEQCIATRCFDVMNDLLRFNICDLESSSILNKNVPGLNERVNYNIPFHLRYACFNWAQHLQYSSYLPSLHESLRHFSYTHLLEWFEVLSLMDAFDRIVEPSLQYALEWIGDKDESLSEILQDAINQASAFSIAVSLSTPHIYISLLPLMMSSSPVARHYASNTISLPRVTYISTGEQKSEMIHKSAIAFSPSGNFIASDACSKLCVWNTVSGKLLFGPLDGHTDLITAIAFSPNSLSIATGSRDMTIRLWERIGSPRFIILNGHTGSVCSIAFSRDHVHLASASEDKTIRIWDIRNGGTIVKVLEGHTDHVYSLTYSLDGSHIISGSADCTTRIWNIERGVTRRRLFRGSTSRNLSVSCSNIGRIVSGGDDNNLRVWSKKSGINTLKGHTDVVNSVSFSPSGDRIISGSQDKTVRVWDASSGNMLFEPLRGHLDGVKSVVSSPDGKCIASSSHDGTIRLWDVNCEQTWYLEEDGWIKNRRGDLLLWIPSKLRASVLNERTIRILNRSLNIKLDFTGSLLGRRWTECFPSFPGYCTTGSLMAKGK